MEMREKAYFALREVVFVLRDQVNNVGSFWCYK